MQYWIYWAQPRSYIQWNSHEKEFKVESMWSVYLVTNFGPPAMGSHINIPVQVFMLQSHSVRHQYNSSILPGHVHKVLHNSIRWQGEGQAHFNHHPNVTLNVFPCFLDKWFFLNGRSSKPGSILLWMTGNSCSLDTLCYEKNIPFCGRQGGAWVVASEPQITEKYLPFPAPLRHIYVRSMA